MSEELLLSPLPSPKEAQIIEDTLKIKERYSGDGEIKGYLENIRGADGTFAVLQEICNEHLQEANSKSWRLLRSLEIVQAPPEVYTKDERENELMSVMHFPGIVLVNDALLREKFPSDLKMIVLHAFCHEIAHVLPVIRAFKSTDDTKSPIEILGTLVVTKDIAKVKLFHLLNETLSDELAETIAVAFAEKTQYATLEEVKAFYSNLRATDQFHGISRKLYTAMVNTLAERQGCTTEKAKLYLTSMLLQSINPLHERSETDKRTVLSVISDDTNFGTELASLTGVNDLDPFIKKYLSR